MTIHTQNPIRPTPTSRHRFHLLDGLRGLAAIAVVYWHSPDYLWSRTGHSNFLAVDFFFCLSGFVVSFAYERRLRDSLPFKEFLAARLIRLYLTFLLAVIVGLPVFFLLSVPHPVGSSLLKHILVLIPLQLLMLPNFGIYPDVLLYPLLNPGWSLFFEILANVAFGVLVKLRRASLPILLLLYAIALMSMIRWTRLHHDVDVGWQSTFKSLCGGIARVTLSFIAGVFVQRIYRHKTSQPFSTVIGTLLALAITSALLFSILTPLSFMQTRQYQLALLSVGFPCLILLGSFCRIPKTLHPLCAFLGDISYPMYLFHYPSLMITEFPWVISRIHRFPSIVHFVVPFMILLIGGFAYLAQVLYDIPVRNFLTRRIGAAFGQPHPNPKLITARE
jgi:peptidoglycan/LPS O-acetylase OafA/YrhL